ncbi:phosphomannomutase [Rubellimicrobium roseum]|uniref:Phosphomannomutase n=1 Tax=Rubellimicrobium roseum TaxID=687525 RepID=A0A5C4N9D3_9RHOB|nr:phosphomannomutase [Rubellimicrobium roseum]TNC66854.1 phosphomannomutase [Rubellimicrobium roseum]
MAPKFGTSGLRGLVTELTPDLVAAHVRAFLAACDTGAALFVGHDLRDSSPAIARVVAEAARACGRDVVDCGALPTPALALAAREADAGAVMVTGSHIPADRNGLKFYLRGGEEIAKADEAAILAALGGAAAAPGIPGSLRADPEAGARYVARYVSAFGPDALAGRRLGLWAHSAVGRDHLAETLRALGAEVVEIDRSETFVPVDTEAVDAVVRTRLKGWAEELRLDAIVSTDGDSDRPLLADEAGRVVPGDVLGQIAAAALGAGVVVTPVSSNSGAEAGGRFARVARTRIGSPFVIAAMEEAARAEPSARVVGYEANGGFLLGFEARGPAGSLPALPTRDAVLPILAVLAASPDGVAARVAEEPARFTAADRLQEIPVERSAALVAGLADPRGRAGLLDGLGLSGEPVLDLTDGVRMGFGERVLHVRPSGNAPELRLYVEAESPETAEDLLARGLERLRAALA